MRTVIDERFRGFEGIAHGGYVGGLLAGEVASSEATFRRPVPIGRDLRVEVRDDGTRELVDGDEVLARASPVDFELRVPPPVSLEESVPAAERSIQRSPGFRHRFPGCFGCGDERAEGDGLRLFPGPVEGRDLVAAPWIPNPATADATGKVRPEVVWAALDCPSIWATLFASDPASAERVVTYRLAVARIEPVRAGVPHVVVGWYVGRESRAHLAGGAVLSAEGRVLAIARHTLAVAAWGVPLGLDHWRKGRG